MPSNPTPRTTQDGWKDEYVAAPERPLRLAPPAMVFAASIFQWLALWSLSIWEFRAAGLMLIATLLMLALAGALRWIDGRLYALECWALRRRTAPEVTR